MFVLVNSVYSCCQDLLSVFFSYMYNLCTLYTHSVHVQYSVAYTLLLLHNLYILVYSDTCVLQLQIDAELMLDANAQELLMSEYPADCCPVKCYIHFPCMAGDEDSPFWQGWAALRIKTFRLVENKYFETAVIAMILLSSLALVSLTWWNPPLQNIVITQGNPGLP